LAACIENSALPFACAGYALNSLLDSLYRAGALSVALMATQILNERNQSPQSKSLDGLIIMRNDQRDSSEYIEILSVEAVQLAKGQEADLYERQVGFQTASTKADLVYVRPASLCSRQVRNSDSSLRTSNDNSRAGSCIKEVNQDDASSIQGSSNPNMQVWRVPV
jgi:hypothetical protein